MAFGRLWLCIVVSLAMVIYTIQATSLENNVQEISTKLAELTEQVSKLSEHLTELTDRVNSIEVNTAAFEDPQIDVIGQKKELQQKMSSSGPVFIRWGRKTCIGTNSEIVYTGLAAGSPTSDAGGGADLLCLPKDPGYANFDSTGQPGSHLFVAEYKLDAASNFPFQSNDPLLRNEDMPCTACQVTDGASVMMIAARVDCYPGWVLEYRGYLMTEAVQTQRSQHICVDDSPEIEDGGSGNATHSVGLFAVETMCEYLPCPPFKKYAEVACVVCSKGV